MDGFLGTRLFPLYSTPTKEPFLFQSTSTFKPCDFSYKPQHFDVFEVLKKLFHPLDEWKKPIKIIDWFIYLTDRTVFPHNSDLQKLIPKKGTHEVCRGDYISSCPMYLKSVVEADFVSAYMNMALDVPCDLQKYIRVIFPWMKKHFPKFIYTKATGMFKHVYPQLYDGTTTIRRKAIRKFAHECKNGFPKLRVSLIRTDGLYIEVNDLKQFARLKEIIKKTTLPYCTKNFLFQRIAWRYGKYNYQKHVHRFFGR